MSRIAVILIAGCGFHEGTVPGDGHGSDGRASDGPVDGNKMIDGSIDAPIDALPDAWSCSSNGLACASAVDIYDCNGNCWVSCRDALLQTQAAKVCKDWGGRLAPLQTTYDQTCVQGMIFPGVANWIGLEQHNNATTLTGEWSWNSDGQPLLFTDWAPGQPNDADGAEDGEEQCAYMSTAGTWQDTGCSATIGQFACRHGD